MAAFNDWNKTIMDEFHANAGKVGGRFEGIPILILETKGAKSGRTRLNPLVYSKDGDRYVIAASKGGAPTNPDWYHNLVANPTASVEVGTETFDVDVTVVPGDERDRLYAKHAEQMPGFLQYEKNTTRKIPVIALTRRK